MSRTADYTIQGFLYQFNKTLLEIISAPEDTKVTVEGIVEDIDIVAPSGTRAVQCKYHEAQQHFSLSLLYKPLLQMMVHFNANPSANVSYILYGYFPERSPGDKYHLTKEDIQQVLSSKNKDHAKYINSLQPDFNDTGFLAAVSIEFGKSMDDLISDVQAALGAAGLPTGDIDLIAYPNAINMIAHVACSHDLPERTVCKANLLARLHSIRSTAISRWTLALKTRTKLLTARRKQLKAHLDINARDRHFLVTQDSLDDFDSGIVLFIVDYLGKYHFKRAHIRTPVFCLDCTPEAFSEVRLRLHQKGIVAEDGLVGDFFDEERFFREPMERKRPGRGIEREFLVRLFRYDSQPRIMVDHKSDDLIIIGAKEYPGLDTQDVNVERLAVSCLKEACFVIGVSHDCE